MTEEHLYTVKLERNMVLPTYVNIKLFKQLKLPIYMDPTGHKCHFKDVSIALTKKALKKKGFPDVEHLQEDSNLVGEWQSNYDSLRSRVVMADYDSGRFWGSIFIAKLFKELRDSKTRKRNDQIDTISLINKRIAYSKKLRKLESDQREKDFQE